MGSPDSTRLLIIPKGAQAPECVAELDQVPDNEALYVAVTNDSVYIGTVVHGYYNGGVYRAPRYGR